MKIQFFVFTWLAVALNSDLASGEFREYASIDDPTCSSDCSSVTDPKAREACFKDQLDFHNYKLVKSIFNFGKASIYAGLWVQRYVRMI